MIICRLYIHSKCFLSLTSKHCKLSTRHCVLNFCLLFQEELLSIDRWNYNQPYLAITLSFKHIVIQKYKKIKQQNRQTKTCFNNIYTQMELSATHRMVLYKYLVSNNKAMLPLDIPSQLRYGSMVLNTIERRPKYLIWKDPNLHTIYINNNHANNINYSMTYSPSLTCSFHLSFWCLLICMNTISKVRVQRSVKPELT